MPLYLCHFVAVFYTFRTALHYNMWPFISHVWILVPLLTMVKVVNNNNRSMDMAIQCNAFASSHVGELKNVCKAFMQNDSKFGIHYLWIYWARIQMDKKHWHLCISFQCYGYCLLHLLLLLFLFDIISIEYYYFRRFIFFTKLNE